ncbi:MFS transporter [Marinobacter oulmenensis]|uniref:NNP family nitrate/nitrite transporter-like MFS transporter n=1 Tax=Marinobacter oulmenensis TaxID=643747 RepID=A0A840UC81_9GAMM|nr:MFS transporter [Marinobacter oulmenensis]MBB5320085.1 NNP family nitrate/nitrite transporter-like MFS transporter [Marinobacter oulmenensis]
MQEPWQEEDGTSLAVVLPLAVTGFVVAAGCWTLFAVAGVELRQGLALNSLQFGALLSAPMAVSAALAIPAGLAARNRGARQVMLWCLAGLAACMALLLLVDTFIGYLLVAGGLGLAGGFYSAGLQFVIRHCPVRRLGLVLGLFGAGVTGAGLNYYLVPLFHEAFSWQGVPVAYLIVLLLLIALLMMLTDREPALAADSAQRVSMVDFAQRLSHGPTFRYCLYFGVVAGSFFALALWLPDFLSAQFGLHLNEGAGLAQWFVIPGALAQVVGGGLSDRYGSARVAMRALVTCLMALFVLSYPPMTMAIQGIRSVIVIDFAMPLPLETAIVVLLGLAMGCAMGSLQHRVILAHRIEASLFAGFLLVAACSVAFVLPMVFGAINQWLGIRTAVFMVLFGLLSGTLWMFAWQLRADPAPATSPPNGLS